jgi:hypothetical protein
MFYNREFISRQYRTPEYEQAVRLLRRMPEMACSAYAEATCADFYQTWAKSRQVTASERHACIAQLLGLRCFGYTEHQTRPGRPPCAPPGSDHARLWLKNRKPVAYTFEPYGLNYKTLKDLVQFCELWRLEFSIDTWPAGHYPSRVLWVEITPLGRPLQNYSGMNTEEES